MVHVVPNIATNRKRTVHRRLLASLLVVVLLACSSGLNSWSTTAQETAQETPSGDVIVVLEDEPAVSVSVAEATAEAEAAEVGVEPTHTYTEVFNGFSASVTPDQAEDLASDPNVAAVFPDLPIHAAAQTIPDNIKRSGATQNLTAAINGIDQRVNADIAILDTGITNPDLNVVGGKDCAFDDLDDDGDDDLNTLADQHGHGTHVAGIAAAIDNGTGVVGVAPGARLYSVRVLDANANGSVSSLICGLDWVRARANTIDVVNLSVQGRGPDGTCGSDPLHEAVCDVVSAGVPVVVAAGNDSVNINDPGSGSDHVIPATYSEAITVSAFTDTDGAPGGEGGSACNGDADDTFAPYSNFGSDVDIAAPGSCILSTTFNGGTGLNTGTSMAVPHITGAIALFEAFSPGASISSIRNWLLTNSAVPQSSSRGFTDDADSVHEPVLWLGPASTPRVVLSPSRGTVNTWMTASVAGFPANLNVWVRWDGELIGKFPISSNGTAIVKFRIPADTMGEHSVRFAAGDAAVIAPYEIAPRIKLIPDTRPRGWGVNVSLRGYAPHEKVRIRWLKGSTWVERGSVTTSSTGSANVKIYVPSWAPNGNAKVRGDGTIAHAQTNAFVVNGGVLNPGQSATKTPTPTPSPSPTAKIPEASPVASQAIPAETATAVIETPTEAPREEPIETPTETPTEMPTETPTPTVCIPPTPTPLVPAAVHQTEGAPDAHVVVDQNPITVWQTAPPAEGEDPAEIVFDIGTPMQIDKLRWLVANEIEAAGMIISVSNDGANWTDIANPANVTPGDWRELTVNAAWRYVRLRFPNPNGAEQIGGLAEVEIVPVVTDGCV